MRRIRKTLRGCLIVLIALVVLSVLGLLLPDSDENSSDRAQLASKSTATDIPPSATRIPPQATSIPSTAETQEDERSLPPTSSIFAVTRYDSPLPKFTHGRISLREGPGAMYAVSSAVPSNSALDVIGHIRDWYEISYDGGLAYVANSDLFDKPLSESSVQEPAAVRATSIVAIESSTSVVVSRFAAPKRRYIHGQVNLRQGPGTDHGLAGSVSAGATLDVVGQSGDWYVIRHNGSEVYIAAWLTYDSPLAQPIQQQPATAVQQPQGNVEQQPPANVEQQPATIAEQPPPENVGQSPPQTAGCAPGPNNQPGVRYDGSCTELRRRGICGFPKGDQNWSLSRDRDKDDCGCDCE